MADDDARKSVGASRQLIEQTRATICLHDTCRMLQPLKLSSNVAAAVASKPLQCTEATMVAAEAQLADVGRQFVETHAKRSFASAITAGNPFSELQGSIAEADAALAAAAGSSTAGTEAMENARAAISSSATQLAELLRQYDEMQAALSEAMRERDEVLSRPMPAVANQVTLADGVVVKFSSAEEARSLLDRQASETAEMRAEAARLMGVAASTRDATRATDAQIESLEAAIAALEAKKTAIKYEHRTEAERWMRLPLGIIR